MLLLRCGEPVLKGKKRSKYLQAKKKMEYEKYAQAKNVRGEQISSYDGRFRSGEQRACIYSFLP
jgi:hypothetical protein